MANQLDAQLQFHTQALGLRAQRQQLLAANIANADTPGFHARDIDFAASLKNALAGYVSGASLIRTNTGHLAGLQQSKGGQVLYRTVMQASLDNNSVDTDVELAHFAQNAVHYEANLTFINGQLKTMLAAIQGQ